MKAITFPARGEVRCGRAADPVAGEGEVVVAVRASGLCHTDFEVLNANYGSSAFPVTPGHEYAGVVAEIGAGVTGLAPGDRVAVDPNFECGACRACRRGWAHLCEGLGAYGVTRDGGFAELSVVRAGAVHPVGALDFAEAALAEPMGCVLNGLDAAHDPVMENALIFGAGPMGLLMAIALGTRGLTDITLVDLDEERLALAESFGFRGAAAGSAALERLRRSVDLVVDATGAPAVAGDLTTYVANGGTCHFFGVCPAEARIGISPFEVFRRQLKLVGSHSLNHNIPAALETLAAFGPGITRLISHRVTLEEMADVLAAKPPRGSLKMHVVFE